MNQKMGMSDFFGLEASEYLEALDGLVSAQGAPDTPEMVRLARALKGSAMMAQKVSIAGVATGLEAIALRVQSGHLSWDERVRQTCIRAVDDLKKFVRQLSNWSEAEEAAANSLIEELESVSGARLSGSYRRPSGGLDTGTRAFIAREGAAVAAALESAATELERGAGADCLQGVYRVKQPLQGLASLADAPPVGDLLDGIDRAMTAIRKGLTQPEPGVAALRAGAKVLANAAREVGARGTAESTADEALDFARMVGSLEDSTPSDAVPIESLYYEDEGPHIISRGTGISDSVDQVEVIAHGEYLRYAADELENATTPAQVELRGQAVSSRLIEFARGQGSELADGLAQFAKSAREAIHARSGDTAVSRLATSFRDAADALAEAREGDSSTIANRLRTLGEGLLERLEDATEAAAEAIEDVTEDTLDRVEDVAEAMQERFSQPDLATPTASSGTETPADSAQEAEPVPSVQYEAANESADDSVRTGDLAVSWAMYERYLAAYGDLSPSLDDLLQGPLEVPRDTRPVSDEEPAPSPAPVAADTPDFTAAEDIDSGTAEPVAVQPEATPDLESLPSITEFCYSGATALERALELRAEVDTALSSGDAQAARELLDEVFDLVELGRQ